MTRQELRFSWGEGFEKLAGAFSHGERDAGIVADSARAFGRVLRHGDSVYHLRGYADERRHRQDRSTARTARRIQGEPLAIRGSPFLYDVPT